MRIVKASEVVKGMRVRVEESREPTIVTTEGIVSQVNPRALSTYKASYGQGPDTFLEFIGGHVRYINANHPVTVLAEPEPEWVEGAWYWVHVSAEYPQALLRVEGGWSAHRGATAARWLDGAPLTVLGRVLIVDWPGDDVARDIERHGTSAPIRFVSALLDKVAAAIRTQGGAR